MEEFMAGFKGMLDTKNAGEVAAIILLIIVIGVLGRLFSFIDGKGGKK